MAKGVRAKRDQECKKYGAHSNSLPWKREVYVDHI